MIETKQCERCGNVLPQAVDLAGRCPICILELGFESAIEFATSAGAAEPAMASIDGGRPEVIGRYRILRLIGEGGMGAVYEAEQDHPRRVVALKIIKQGMASTDLLRRFEQESQALGRLQHPGIAQIYEAGTLNTGFGPQPYFAMEFIRGSSPREHAQAHQLNTRDRMKIMSKICDAVHHAHQRGLIHRDLKPANILVDETGQPKILDFGVARVTDSDSKATRQTDMGQLVGTLAYMSPEQVLADPSDIDTRSDVYALGVILYELLTGRLPYTISRKIHETIQTIREEDPARLSAVSRTYRGDIETIVAKALEKDRTRRYASAAEMAADIQRYLNDEPIVARPPSASYQLRKFARRHRALVAGVAVVFVVLVAAVATSLLIMEQAIQARDQANINKQSETQARVRETEQRQLAESARVEADAQRDSAEREFAKAQVNLYRNNIDLADREWLANNIGHSDRLLDEAPSAQRDWEWNYLVRRNHMEDTVLAGHGAPIVAIGFDPDTKRLRTVSTDCTFRDWDIRTRKSATGTFCEASDGRIVTLQLSANSRTLYARRTRTINGELTMTHTFWNLSTGKESFSLPNSSIALIAPKSAPGLGWGPVALSPDGSHVVAVEDSGRDGATRYTLRYFDIRTGRELRALTGYPDRIYDLVFSPDGSKVAVIRSVSTTVLEVTSGQTLATLANSQNFVAALAFSSDGASIAGFRDGSVHSWKVADGNEQWSSRTGTAQWSIGGGTASQIAFSPDTRFIAAALADRTLRILESVTGKEIARLTGHLAAIRALRFSPDGTQVIAAGEDNRVRVWNLKPVVPDQTFVAGRIESPVRVSPEGDSILVLTSTGLKSWDTDIGQFRFEVPFLADLVRMDLVGVGTNSSQIVFSPPVSGPMGPRELQVWDARTGREIAVLHPPQKDKFAPWAGFNARISPDGSRVALISLDVDPKRSHGNTAQIWETTSGRLLTTLHLGSYQGSDSFRFSANGKMAAAFALPADGSKLNPGVDVYDTTTGLHIARIEMPKLPPFLSYMDVSSEGKGIHSLVMKEESPTPFLEFSHGGGRLAVVSGGTTLTIWDTRSGAELVSFPEFGSTVAGIAFNPEGTRLASVSSDGEVFLWDANSGRVLIPLRDCSGPCVAKEVTIIGDTRVSSGSRENPKALSISFSGDGHKIIRTSVDQSSKDTKVRITTWDGTPRR
jgi:eukaryotic-like serine/threonine-protein kinase